PILDVAKEMKEIFGHYELTKKELKRTKDLIDKIENHKITLSVIGQFKRGKSMLVNSMLGDSILPVGIVPVTAVVTTIEYGEKAAAVRFSTGIIKEIPFEDMAAYIDEQLNTDNHLSVRQVKVFSPSDFLKDGMTLVDTPGVGSVHQKNTDEAYAFVKESDAVIFMLSVDSPINQIEVDFLRNASEFASKFYFVVNKIDQIDSSDLESYVNYCTGLIKKLMGTDEIQLFSVSAKTGEGVEALKEAVKKDCDTRMRDIVEKSAVLKMKDIGKSALSQIMLYRTTLQMTHRQFDDTFLELERTFADLREEAQEYLSHFKSNPKMLEAGLNDIRNKLSDEVSRLFRIDYYYDISSVDLYRGGKVDDEGRRDLSEEFMNALEGIFDELETTVRTVFMYKEDNTYTVTQRIYDVNKLVRRLVRLRTELERTPEEQARIDRERKPEFKKVNCE
ncbi:MAG: dynamin family protein, partial [Firmicutes bacterium]|nr:dynamin family protein [Bacillota bacterium]